MKFSTIFKKLNAFMESARKEQPKGDEDERILW